MVGDLETGRAVRSLAGHEGLVNAVSVFADGRRAISASSDRTLKVWGLATGALLASFTGDASMRCCAVAPTGEVIVAGDVTGRVHFLRLEGVRE